MVFKDVMNTTTTIVADRLDTDRLKTAMIVGVVASLLILGLGLAQRLLEPIRRKITQWRKAHVGPPPGESENYTRDPFGFSDIVPFKGLPIEEEQDWPRYWKAGKYNITMGLRKLNINNWLTFDDKWLEQHNAKLEHLKRQRKEEIVDYIDGIDEAVVELLEMVVEYVTKRFPDMFQLEGDYIVIKPTKERYRVKAPYDMHPMEIQGLLVMDDLYILKRGDRDLYYLRGAFLAAPTAWRLDQRIGWPLYQIHDAVPQLREKLQKSMDRFFLNLKVTAPIQRNNLFIQPCPGIFHHDSFHSYPVVTRPDGVWIRTELQSLRRLPKSRAVVFSVRTYLANLTELRAEPENLEMLWDHVRNFPEAVNVYKCRHLWNDTFEQFCKDTLKKENPEIDEEGRGVGVKRKQSMESPRCPAGF